MTMISHYANMVTYRDVLKGARPAAPVPAQPFPLPPLVVAKLRGLKAQYDAVLDTALLMEGFETGCALDLTHGMVYPPGSLALTQNQEAPA